MASHLLRPPQPVAEEQPQQRQSAEPALRIPGSESAASELGEIDFRFESDQRLEFFSSNFELSMKKFYQNTLIEVVEGLETLFIYVRNLLQNPGDHRFSRVASLNVHFQERLGRLIGSDECMRAIGFDLNSNGWNYKFDYRAFANDEGWTHLNSAKEEILQRLEVLQKQFDALPVRLSEEHCYTSVVAAGSHHERGHRPAMEDDEMLVDAFLDRPGYGFFALYDGHGGRETVEFVVKVMQMNLAQVMLQDPDIHLNEAVMQAYELTDAQLRRQNILKSGTTAVTCVIKPADGDYDEADHPDYLSESDSEYEDSSDFEEDDQGHSRGSGGSSSDSSNWSRRRRRHRREPPAAAADDSQHQPPPPSGEESPFAALNRRRVLYVSNVGDSRAVLCRGRRAVRLTVDHKATLLEEGERIVEAGGFVSRRRVNGILAISRALGDHMLKRHGDVVSCIPYCTVTRLRPRQDRFLILACDGVWDVMSDQQAVDFVLDHVDDILHEKMGPLGGPELLLRQDRETYQRLMNEVLCDTSAELVRQALDKGSTDNITVILLQLNWPQI